MKKIFFLLPLLLILVKPLPAATVCWAHPWLKPMLKEELPPALPEKVIRVKLTPGEFEPACFALRSERDTEVSVSLARLERSEGSALLARSCEVLVVESLADSTQPNRLYPFSGPVKVRAGQTRYFWITVRLPENTPAGTYKTLVKIAGGPWEGSLTLECRVLPFKLVDSPVAGGVFMAGTDIPESWYRDMKSHGLDAIQFFWGGTGIEITRDGERPRLDFSGMERFMTRVAAAGLKGPVIISLGNDHSLHYERRLAEVFDIPVLTSDSIDRKPVIGPAVTPRLDSLFVDGLRQIDRYWRGRGWPQELVVLIYDEPTERLLTRCRQRYQLLKSVMPATRVYGVVMNRRSWAESMVDQCDVIVADGDFPGCREVAERYDKDYWVYSFPLRTVHGTRYDMGCLPWRVNAQGAFFWMYNYWGYDPDGCAVYPHPVNPAQVVRSAPWEAVREGMDDLRYFATAQWLIERAPTGLKEKAARRLETLRGTIDPGRRRGALRGEAHDEMSVLAHFSLPQRARDEATAIILELLHYTGE